MRARHDYREDECIDCGEVLGEGELHITSFIDDSEPGYQPNVYITTATVTFKRKDGSQTVDVTKSFLESRYLYKKYEEKILSDYRQRLMREREYDEDFAS